MRNLKRVLALVLALTMVLSFAISASAGAFTDVKDGDDYASAINLLASLEVLKGFEDGTYNSAGSYTREQFAKILYVLVNGKDDNAAMYQGTAPFPDVDAGRWSAGYITWAVNLGICNGRDDGNFWPTDVVKYAEACKMFLIAMGYSSTIYTYPYGFIDKASTLKLFDDIQGYTTFGDANRGTVAQMAYNALFAEAPRFGTYTAKEGETTTTNVKLLIMGAFGVSYNYAILNGTATNAYNSAVYNDNQIELLSSSEAIKDNTYITLAGGRYVYEDNIDDLIGMVVKVWGKEDTNSLGNVKIYMVEDANKSVAYTVNPKDIDGDRTEGDTLYFKQDGSTRKLTIDKIDLLTYDGDTVRVADATALKADKTLDGRPTKGQTFRLIDLDGNGSADLGYLIEPQFGKITAVSSSRISMTKLSGGSYLSGANDIEDDDGNVIITLYDGAKVDDYAMAYAKRAVVDGALETVYDIVKAETVGNVKHNRVSGSSIYFGGTAYKLMNNIDPENDLSLGSNYDLYLNANGYVAFADEIDEDKAGNWILVTDANNYYSTRGLSRVDITGYLSDGTKKTFTLDLDEVKAIDGILSVSGTEEGGDGWQSTDWNQLYTYTLGEDGLIDALKALSVESGTGMVSSDLVSSADTGDFTASYDEDTTQLVASGSEVAKSFVTSNSVIFNVYTDDNGKNKVAVLKDTDLPEFASTKGYKVTQIGAKSGNVVVAVIDSNDEALTAETDKYGLVISADKYAANANDKYYYVLTVAVDGQIKELTTKDVDGASDLGDFENEDAFAKNSKMLGYFKIVTNSAGKVTSLDSIEEDAKSTLVSGVVTAIPSSKGLEVADGITYDVLNGDVVIKGVSGTKEVYLYDADAGFYAINAEPGTVTDLDNDEDVSEATKSSLIKSSVGDLAAIDEDDLFYVVDLIVTDIGTDDEEVVGTYIYTTPVAGVKGEVVTVTYTVEGDATYGKPEGVTEPEDKDYVVGATVPAPRALSSNATSAVPIAGGEAVDGTWSFEWDVDEAFEITSNTTITGTWTFVED